MLEAIPQAVKSNCRRLVDTMAKRYHALPDCRPQPHRRSGLVPLRANQDCSKRRSKAQLIALGLKHHRQQCQKPVDILDCQTVQPNASIRCIFLKRTYSA